MARWLFICRNYGVLNHELIDFQIISESHGKNGEWLYGVNYREYFEHLPRFMENTAIGHFVVHSDHSKNVSKYILT